MNSARRAVIPLAIAAALLMTSCGEREEGGTPTTTTTAVTTTSTTEAPCPTTTTTTTTSTTAATTTTTTNRRPTTSRPAPTSTAVTNPPTTAATSAPAKVISRFATSAQLIALTFDAGSDRGSTVRILDTLRSHGARASFGITGEWATANPDLVCRIFAEGHAVINHSYDHPSFTGYSTKSGPLSQADRLAQLRRTEDLITQLGGAAKPWFRPPYGDIDASVQRDVGAAGYRYIAMWTVDSLGWKGIPAPDVERRVLAAASPGAIVLMHVGAASTDVGALPAILSALQGRGYSFKTVRDFGLS